MHDYKLIAMHGMNSNYCITSNLTYTRKIIILANVRHN